MQPNALAIANRKATPEEAKFMESITKSGAKIEVVIPADMDPKEWIRSTSWVCRGIIRADLQTSALLPVLGRLLLVAKENPEIWAKYETFENFLTAEVYEAMAIGRSTAYEAMQIAKRYPDLEMKEYQAIGRQGFRVINQAIAKGEEGKKYAAEVIEVAKVSKVKDLRAFCEEKGYLDPGETQGAYFSIPCNKTQLKFFEKFIKNPEYQVLCGSEKPAKMLEKAIIEATTEWQAQITEALEVAGVVDVEAEPETKGVVAA